MKIAIDPGHGLASRNEGVFDPGAVASAAGKTFKEAEIVMEYSLTLKQLLVDKGIAVHLTRDSNTDPAPLSGRTAAATAAGCTHLVSIHLNSFGDPAAEGLEVLYRNDVKDKPLAKELQQKLLGVTGFKDRGVKDRDDLAILKFNAGPAVLIELGFISHTEDRSFVIVKENRIKVCEAIVDVLL
jgi:N-acetylmuramoyl-L-alanine amidase